MDREEREKGDDDVMVKTTTTTSHVGVFLRKKTCPSSSSS